MGLRDDGVSCFFVCLVNLPSAYSVDLEVNPPNAGDANDAPKVCFAQESSGRSPLDESEPDEASKEEEWYAQEEDEL